MKKSIKSVLISFVTMVACGGLGIYAATLLDLVELTKVKNRPQVFVDPACSYSQILIDQLRSEGCGPRCVTVLPTVYREDSDAVCERASQAVDGLSGLIVRSLPISWICGRTAKSANRLHASRDPELRAPVLFNDEVPVHGPEAIMSELKSRLASMGRGD